MALKLFVGGLNSRQSESELYTYFSQFGPIRAAKVVRGGPEKRSKCFGFIWLQSSDVKDRILSFKKHVLEDRVLVVNHAVDGRKNGNALLQTLSQKKLFIGGLGPNTSSDDLHGYFSQFGEVHSAFVICQPHSRVSRRFGYVEFVDPAIADQVVGLNDLTIHGQKIGCRRFGDNRLEAEVKLPKPPARKQQEAASESKNKSKRKETLKTLKSVQKSKQDRNADLLSLSNGMQELLVALRNKAAPTSTKHSVSIELAGNYKSPTVDLYTKRYYGVHGDHPADQPDSTFNYRFNTLVLRSSYQQSSVKPSINSSSEAGY